MTDTTPKSEPQKVKFERQMNLLALLLESPRGVTRRDVVREMSREYSSDDAAARRTFERDKEDLLRLGVPIEQVGGTSNEDFAYTVRREKYDQPDPGFEPDELAALRLALEAVRIGTSNDEIARAMWRLGGLVDPDEGVEADEIIGAAASDRISIPSFESLRPLTRAAVDRAVVSFTYEGSGGPGARRIEPWALSLARGHWYVRGFDLDRQAPRLFRLDRIVGSVKAKAPGTATATRSDEQVAVREIWNLSDEPQETVRLWVDESQADLVRRRLHGCSETPSDGGVIFTFGASWLPALRQFVLELLDHAVVLEPQAFRDDIVTWLRAVEHS